MSSKRRVGSALALLWLVAATAAAGQEAEAGSLGGGGLLESFALSADRGPVEIEAQTLEFAYRTGRLTYEGGVRVSQGEIELRSDWLQVVLNTEDLGRPRAIVALGNVRIVSGERVATGGRAEFDQERQTITLSDDAVLRDGPNEVAGDKVVVFLDEERSVVEGGESRVRAVLFPSGHEKPGEDSNTTVSRAPGDGQ